MMPWRPVLIALAISFTVPARAAMVESGFTESVYLSSAVLQRITGMAWAPDGSRRLFLALKNGGIHIVREGALVATPFVTVSPVYSSGSETGLIGLAFDPDYVTNRFLYVLVTVSDSEQRIYRYRDAGDVGVDQTALVTGLPTAGVNHNGGGIGIGHDGHLYWTIRSQTARARTTTSSGREGFATRSR
jgi:glucose/arabinose dehydrogenase